MCVGVGIAKLFFLSPLQKTKQIKTTITNKTKTKNPAFHFNTVSEYPSICKVWYSPTVLNLSHIWPNHINLQGNLLNLHRLFKSAHLYTAMCKNMYVQILIQIKEPTLQVWRVLLLFSCIDPALQGFYIKLSTRVRQVFQLYLEPISLITDHQTNKNLLRRAIDRLYRPIIVQTCQTRDRMSSAAVVQVFGGKN